MDGQLTKAQINKIRVESHTKMANAEKKHFPLKGLPREAALSETATIEAERYLTNYSGD